VNPGTEAQATRVPLAGLNKARSMERAPEFFFGGSAACGPIHGRLSLLDLKWQHVVSMLAAENLDDAHARFIEHAPSAAVAVAVFGRALGLGPRIRRPRGAAVARVVEDH
jgi:hypothetical protein